MREALILLFPYRWPGPLAKRKKSNVAHEALLPRRCCFGGDDARAGWQRGLKKHGHCRRSEADRTLYVPRGSQIRKTKTEKSAPPARALGRLSRGIKKKGNKKEYIFRGREQLSPDVPVYLSRRSSSPASGYYRAGALPYEQARSACPASHQLHRTKTAGAEKPTRDSLSRFAVRPFAPFLPSFFYSLVLALFIFFFYRDFFFTLPDYNLSFEMNTDASNYGSEVVL